MIMAVFYIILVITFGCSLIMRFIDVNALYSNINTSDKSTNIPEFLFIISSGSAVGILITTFVCYYLIYFINVFFPTVKEYSYIIGIIFCCLIFILLTIFNFKNRYKIKLNNENSRYYLLTILLLFLLTTFLIFYSYFVRDGILYVGPTVHSDLSPHTALTASFGIGANIPTSYIHFSNDGIRYHFLFYFFTGLLKYLKMPLDMALNIPSIIGIVDALILVGLLANLISNNKKAFLIAPLLVLFRSSLNIFDLIYKQPLITFISRLISNDDWYQTTPYDEWGLWAINVYANQRHLMFGISILLIIIIIFLPYFLNFFKNIKKYTGIEKLKYFCLDKENWKIKNYKILIFSCILIIALPYFHGSVLISLLLILFVMAIFSENRLSYLIIAIVAVCSSCFQTLIFSGNVNNIISLKYAPGFIFDDCLLMTIVKYIFILTGLTFVLSYVYIIKKDKLYFYVLSIAFLLPTIFAFLFQLTIDILANHKFILITIILFDIFVAGFLCEYYDRKKLTLGRKIIELIMIFMLTATGVSEWFIYINMNKDLASFNENSEVTRWIKENTLTNDTFLTPYWSMNEVYLSGRQIYYGWPYYAWSAGHDTDSRYEIYKYLLTGCNDNIEEFIEICKKEKIKYFVDTDEYYEFDTINTYNFHRDYIINNLRLVKNIPNENIAIYQIY